MSHSLGAKLSGLRHKGYITDIEYQRLKKALEQEPKTGHWIVKKDCEGKTRKCICDKCGYETGKYTWKNPNYCAECGARMEVEQNG